MPEIKSILVTGSNGQLGQSLTSLSLDYPQYQFTFVNRDDLDLSNMNSVSEYFKNNQFDLIINCAAYTAVDKAEQEQELADAINHLAVKQLAKITQDQASILIHISTDYVFDGTNHKPYVENDKINPQSVYGISKLKGELAIQSIAPKAIIIRTSWVYSEYGNNFVKTMLRLGRERESLNVIFDQIGSPTYAKDLADSILQMVVSFTAYSNVFQQESVHLYHYSNEGVCSWYDFAKAIFELSNIACTVSAIESKDYPTPAKRPHYSVLNKAKIKQNFDLTIPYWKDSLQACLKNLQKG
ncbi:MAG: dTDP-4-dehydrorhamnose reductase [Methylococcaceae bacterium]|nr:dTDP-4-dehydrorhamnose reductase [Methylococcaceae bacterium]